MDAPQDDLVALMEQAATASEACAEMGARIGQTLRDNPTSAYTVAMQDQLREYGRAITTQANAMRAYGEAAVRFAAWVRTMQAAERAWMN